MKFAILVFPGSGCDVDMYHAINEVLGEEAEYFGIQKRILKALML